MCPSQVSSTDHPALRWDDPDGCSGGPAALSTRLSQLPPYWEWFPLVDATNTFLLFQYIEYVLTLPFEFITWKIVHLWFVSPLFFPPRAGKFNTYWAAVVAWIQMVANYHHWISTRVVQLLDYGLSGKMLAMALKPLKINKEIIMGLCMSEWNNFLKSPMRIFTIIPITPMMEMSYNQLILSFFFFIPSSHSHVQSLFWSVNQISCARWGNQINYLQITTLYQCEKYRQGQWCQNWTYNTYILLIDIVNKAAWTKTIQDTIDVIWTAQSAQARMVTSCT